MKVFLKAYENGIYNRGKMNNELIRIRVRFEHQKLKIDSLKNELVIAKDKCIILSEKCSLAISERNVLVDNMHLNVVINKLHNSINMIESHEHMSHNFRRPWSKVPSIGFKFPKPIATPIKELQN